MRAIRIPIPLLRLLAPVGAVLFAMVVSGIILALSGSNPFDAFRLMWDFGTTEQSIASTVDRAVPLYLSGVAFAIAFKWACSTSAWRASTPSPS